MLCLQKYAVHTRTRTVSHFLVGEQKRYTFRSFKQEVDSLAASLLELGFEKNDRFAVWLPNTSENVVMTYAASKLGLIKVSHVLVTLLETPYLSFLFSYR